MLPLLFGAGLAAALLVLISRRSAAIPTESPDHGSSYEVQGYNPATKGIDAPAPFRSLDDARAFAENLISRGYNVAVRYVPPGYVPGDLRSEAKTSIYLAHPSNYDPWRKKSPREA